MGGQAHIFFVHRWVAIEDKMGKEIIMNAVAFNEGNVWIVQGIEYNLAAVARSVQDIPKAFANLLIERLHVAEHLGVQPFQGIAPAPQRFHQMFDEAMTEMKQTRPVGQTQTIVRLAEVAEAA